MSVWIEGCKTPTGFPAMGFRFFFRLLLAITWCTPDFNEMIPFDCKIFMLDAAHVWCETHFFLADSAFDAMANLRTLATLRAAFLGGQAVVSECRVSGIGDSVQILRDGIANTQHSANSLHSDTCCLVRMFTDPTPGEPRYSAPLYLRGLPTTFWVGNTEEPDQIDPFWRSRLDNYLNGIINLGFSLQVRDKALPSYPVMGLTRIATADNDAFGNPLNPATLPYDGSVIVLVGQFGSLQTLLEQIPTALVRVRLSGVKWSDGIDLKPYRVNGVHYLTGFLQGALAINGQVPPTGNPVRYGSVRLVQTIYPQIAECITEGGTKRNTGGRSKYHRIVSVGSAPVAPIPPPQAVGLGISSGGPRLPPIKYYPPPDGSDYIPAPTYGNPASFLPGSPGGQPDRILTNCLDLMQMIWEGYTGSATSTNTPIRIAQVLNFPNTWAVICSGTTLSYVTATGIPEDIQAAFGLISIYTEWIIYRVKKTCPRGCRLFLSGDSLAGMELQTAIDELRTLGYVIVTLVTFGAPITSIAPGSAHWVRFQLVGDIVPQLSPLAIVLLLLFNPEQTVLNDPAIKQGMPDAHLGYHICSLLENYGCFGQLQDLPNKVELQLAKAVSFTVPVVSPPEVP